MDVTVDVMLPFYGDVGHLKEAVSSVMQQDVPDWRLTVVDDAHPDPAVQRWFGDLDCPRIRYERNTQNLGANGNYRKCLSLVEHDLDSTLEHLVEAAMIDKRFGDELQRIGYKGELAASPRPIRAALAATVLLLISKT
mgnify:CR=1 FL=1